MNKNVALAVSFLGGAAIGAALGLLLAPDSGERQRRKIRIALQRHGINLSADELEKLLKKFRPSTHVEEDDAVEPVE
jgi:gas vesicle protein